MESENRPAKFSNQMNLLLRPKASSSRSDWYRAWLAGQMKNTSVMMICGATSAKASPRLGKVTRFSNDPTVCGG